MIPQNEDLWDDFSMLDVGEILQPFFSILWFFVGTAIFVAIVVILWQVIFSRRSGHAGMSAYEKRKYLFDTTGEYKLFKLLQENFGSDYYVFPQVHYSHIVQARRSLPYRDRLAYWNKINRKSADFVLCDRQEIIPRLVIELDGESHQLRTRQERDAFINDLADVTGLEMLHVIDHSYKAETVTHDVRTKLGLLSNPQPEDAPL